MHKVHDKDGAVSGVTVTADEWKAIDRDYKSGRGEERRALVLCPKNGTVLVPVQITPDGLPIEGER
jgi:hypothetical protein